MFVTDLPTAAATSAIAALVDFQVAECIDVERHIERRLAAGNAATDLQCLKLFNGTADRTGADDR